jgi:AcrR family transcriptional regulator
VPDQEVTVEPDAAAQPAPDVVVLPGLRTARDPARALKIGTQQHSRVHVAEMQRERLMDAFVQVVADNGYESAGIKLVCQRAGVAFSTFYVHFRSKEHLFLAAYDAGVEILFKVAGDAYLAGDVPWRQRVEAGLGSFLQTLSDNPAFARFFSVEVHKVGPEARRRIDDSFESAFGMFMNATPSRGLAIPVEELGPLVIGGIYSRIHTYIRTGRARELPDLRGTLTEFAVAVFRGSAVEGR